MAGKSASKTQVKKIQTVTRKTNSLSGNPQFTVFFTDGTQSVTAKDAACAYDLITPNPEFVAPNLVMVEFERGQIATLTPVKE